MVKRDLLAVLASVSVLFGANEVVFETSAGKVVFALKPEIAPKAC